MGSEPYLQTVKNEINGVTRVDMTGREQMARNVLASWAGHFVFIIAGFIMPRMIDGQIGQEALGVWDFAWSLIAYFSMVQFGVVSSINRYVAKYRAAGDIEGVNRVVSSVTCVLLLMAFIVVILTVTTAFAVPTLLIDRLGGFALDAQWVIFLLGLSMAIQIALSGYGGVLTGCHCWGLHNAVGAGSYAVTVLGMIVILLFGNGLPGLALMYLCGDGAGRVVRVVLAYRICPQLKVRFAYAQWHTALRMLGFGGKSFLPGVAELLLNSTVSVLIIGFLGPAALAIYTRPRHLVSHVRMIVTKLAFVLTPASSSLQSMNQKKQLQDLLVKATRYGVYVSLPMTLALTILGGPFLRFWMGPRYEYGLVLGILAAGYFTFITQLPAVSVLAGMNAHGRVGLANALAKICAIGMTFLVLGPFKLGLTGVAVAITVPLTIVNALYVPIHACRRIGISVRHYLLQSFMGPVLCAIPFGLCLVGVRLIFADSPGVTLMCGGIVTVVVLAPLYWRYVLPQSFKQRIADVLGFKSGRGKQESRMTQ